MILKYCKNTAAKFTLLLSIRVRGGEAVSNSLSLYRQEAKKYTFLGPDSCSEEEEEEDGEDLVSPRSPLR